MPDYVYLFAVRLEWKENSHSFAFFSWIHHKSICNVCNMRQDSCLFLHLRGWTAVNRNKKTCHEENKREIDCRNIKTNREYACKFDALTGITG